MGQSGNFPVGITTRPPASTQAAIALLIAAVQSLVPSATASEFRDDKISRRRFWRHDSLQDGRHLGPGRPGLRRGGLIGICG